MAKPATFNDVARTRVVLPESACGNPAPFGVSRLQSGNLDFTTCKERLKFRVSFENGGWRRLEAARWMARRAAWG